MKKIFILLLIFFPIILSAQNVGIDKSNPQAKLEIKQTSNLEPTLMFSDSTGNSAGRLRFRSLFSQYANRGWYTDYKVGTYSKDNEIFLYNDSTNVMNIYGTGNITIGDGVTPNARLSVLSDNPSSDILNIMGSSSQPALKILGNRNVGIGNPSPIYKLDVSGDMNVTGAMRVNGNAGTTGQLLTSNGTSVPAWTDAATIFNTGNAGFGVWGDCATNGNIGGYNPVVDTTGAINDNFGYSVSISGNYAIVGAYLDDVGANADQGSASIFQWNGANWVMMQKITDATGAIGDQFGYSVSISGNYAIVGALWDDGAFANQGSASIYQLSGGTWVLMNKITDATGAVNDFFGYSVSISDNYAIVGALLDDGAFADQGSASVYQWNGSNWVLMNKITDATGAANDIFGGSVSISGNYAIVGAYADDVGANANQGSASIYQYNGSSWVLMQQITDASGAVNDNFGFSVSISGNYAIVGANLKNVGANVFQGSATIYQRVGLAWLKLQYITDPAGIVSDQFGYTTAIDGTNKRFLIGVPNYAGNSGKTVFGKVN